MKILIEKEDFYVSSKGIDSADHFNNLNNMSDVYGLLKDSFKDIHQKLMQAELDASLGYEKSQKRNVQTSNRRNGYSPKH